MVRGVPSVAERIRESLRGKAVLAEDEAALGRFMQSHLSALGLDFSREHRLDATSRPDFFADGCAIELKIKGSWADAYRQLDRYLGFDSVAEALLVTTRLSLARIPDSARGKPIFVAWLGGAGL